MNFIKYFSASVFAALALVACDGKKELDYLPADPVTPGQRVYFASASESFEVRDNSASVSLDIYRPESETATAQTVELEVDDPSGLFAVPAVVTIPAGQISAPVEITYNWQALVEDETYDLDIAISEIAANQYALSSTSVSITRSNWTEWNVSTLTPKGVGRYIFTQYYSGEESPVRLICRTNIYNDQRIQYALQWLDDPDDKTSWASFIRFESKDGGKTFQVPMQEFTVNADYGTVYVSSVNLCPFAEEYIAYGEWTEDEVNAPSYFDSEKGEFNLNVAYFVSIGVFGNGYEYFILNDYTAPSEPQSVRKGAPVLKLRTF